MSPFGFGTDLSTGNPVILETQEKSAGVWHARVHGKEGVVFEPSSATFDSEEKTLAILKRAGFHLSGVTGELPVGLTLEMLIDELRD